MDFFLKLSFQFIYFLDTDSRERQKACELLEDCKESIVLPLIGTSGITVEVAGLKIMNDDPGNSKFQHYFRRIDGQGKLSFSKIKQ